MSRTDAYTHELPDRIQRLSINVMSVLRPLAPVIPVMPCLLDVSPLD
ncbi:hypothetical protein SynBMKMC1_01254 [Synechococcus sp. BMK-MC-1]|nr:hypothetical protein SynBMKMC1_01254 [Synechococcus sp. BMK-MC-1]